MRTLFLLLSENTRIKHWMSKFRLARRAAGRFVAGDRIEDAMAVMDQLNRAGMTGTLDHLGENTDTEQQAIAAADAYLVALDHIKRSGVESFISVKLTQLGLDLGIDFCLANVGRIAAHAQETGNFMRIDMEGSDYTQRTLDVLYALREKYNNVGIVIQAYLYRSRADVARLIEAGVPVRLCKGAYDEPASLAFPDKVDVDQNLIDLMHMLLSPRALETGAELAMATHDEKIIKATKAYALAHNIPPSAYEFQMLYGIRSAYQRQLVDEGYRMRVYVPYGTEWYPYYMRRLAERPANIWFILSNFFRQ